MSASAAFSAEVEDVHQSIRKTNNLLRAANAVRNLNRDIQELIKRPTFAKFFWTLVQISRTYTALRRVMKATFVEAGVEWKIKKPTIIPPIIPAIPQLTMRVDAFRDNLPMRLEGIDLSGLPEETLEAIQRLLEEDAEETVADAKAILAARIINQAESTGFLESSITWQSEVFGTRIIAGAPYAWWVEEGHRIINPKPRGDLGSGVGSTGPGRDFFPGHHYMKGAVDLARQRLPDKILQELNYLITRET